MIPKEIALQLAQLKEKVKTYSSIQRSLDVAERRDEVDEIKEAVENVNSEIVDIAKKTDNILMDGLISKFEIENWFEDLKDKSDFPEPNPREIYEEEQREIERKIAEKLAKQKEEGIERHRKIAEKLAKQKEEGIERHRKIAEEEARQKQEEIERQQQIEEERAKKELEKQHQERICAKRIEEFKNLCYDVPDDTIKLRQLIDEDPGLIRMDDFDCLQTCIERQRSIKVICLLLDSGARVTHKNINYCYKNYTKISNFNKLIKVLKAAENIEIEVSDSIRKSRNKLWAKHIAYFFAIIAGACLFVLFIIYIKEILDFLLVLLIFIIALWLFVVVNTSPRRRR